MICDMDCFNCKFDDCINDEVTRDDYQQSHDLDRMAKADRIDYARCARQRYERDYYAKNIDNRRAYQREYRGKNKYKMRDYWREYYARNRSKILAYNRAYYRAYRAAKKAKQEETQKSEVQR